ncbi:MAG TPA: acetyl-CoA hydrolase/transferase C-terminal domain-containing protein [Patescibacteria group bacterium]|nr:acetyl-CoA hydrolase/transferase C-terminal domain-containing protein [Patescibacteria group bacterium]
MTRTDFVADTATALARILERCPQAIVAAAPLGLGKPNRLLNALYAAIKADPARSLQLFTALSLARPQPKPGLEARFAQPFIDRHFGADYPDLGYVLDQRSGQLPANVSIHEFYFQSGAWLGNDTAQRHYASINYTHVARDMAARTPSLLLQLVARRGDRLSLSCNPDVTLELLERMAANGQPRPYVVAVVHPDLPFLGNDAEVGLDFADLLVEDAADTQRLFALPREPVLPSEHAIGLHAASIVKDGGTLQIGIGALSDAIVHALLWRDRDPAAFDRSVRCLASQRSERLPWETGRFEVGLYGASEMVMDGFMHLRKAGILRRQVFDDLGLQRLLNAGSISEVADASTLDRFIEAGQVSMQLDRPSLAWLQKFGLVDASVELVDGELRWSDGMRSGADLSDRGARRMLIEHMAGKRLVGGRYLHGAFWLGTKQLQDWLGTLSTADFDGLCMTRVAHINQLYGGREALDIAQRHDPRFFNTCMMATVFGAAVSDGLGDGQVVSGVGGQYNFVAMAHEIPNSRSALTLRATRDHAHGTCSNIVWNYAHATIPRHLRDLVITEYGIADLRGATDEECVQRMLAICDARFVDALVSKAKDAGKLSRDYALPDAARANTPQGLHDRLKASGALEHLPKWPFGSDFDATELCLIGALKHLKARTSTTAGRLGTIARALLRRSDRHAAALARMGLSAPQGTQDKLMARLLCLALDETAPATGV